MRFLPTVIVVLAVATAYPVAARSVPETSACYIRLKDKTCFFKLYAHLKIGMRREDVQRLMGEADYSPIDGQVRYSVRSTGVSLVIEYRDRTGIDTGRIVGYRLIDAR